GNPTGRTVGHPGQRRAALARRAELQPVRELRTARRRLRRLREVRSLAFVTNQTATYLANPEDVHRVLLLYSGGLDTSVMLKWIQENYEAEVVALTVNLGQPGEDYDVIQGKARQLGALDSYVVDARAKFAAEYVLPAIKANAIYGLGYP